MKPVPHYSPELFDALGKELYRYIRRLRVAHEEAQDIVQCVLEEVLKASDVQGGREGVRRLTFRIAHNKYVDLCRRGGVRSRATLPGPPGGARELEKWVLIEQLFDALEEKNPTWAEVLRLQVLHDMDVDTIAATLDMKPETVRSNLARAREWLRSHFPDARQDGRHERG